MVALVRGVWAHPDGCLHRPTSEGYRASMGQGAVLNELTPVVASLLDRHLATAKEWFPHEFVPWEQGRAFVPGEAWEPGADGCLPAGVRSAVLVNLLTEDNLPYYTQAIFEAFGQDGPWGEWARRWTAEEGRHATAVRDWVLVSRQLDPVALERGRMQQVSCGVVPDPWSAEATIVYVAMQELATRLAHFNTAKRVDEAGCRIMKRVAADENLHFLFYRDLAAAAFAVDPSRMTVVLDLVARAFAMPGVGIDGFTAHTAAIADEGIFSLQIFHDHVLVPMLRFWDVEQLAGLDAEADEARQRLFTHVARVGRIAARAHQQTLERSAGAG